MPPSASRRLLLMHAHPDDETITTGGTMARYAAAGVHVTLVTATLGEQGEVIGAELAADADADAADQLGGYRIDELAAACAALGVTDQRFLGGAGRWRDSGMVVTGDGIRAAAPESLHPRAFAASEAFDDQVAALVAVLADVAPQVVISYDARGGYGHPDHVRAHEITMAAVRQTPSVHRVYATVAPAGVLAAGLAELRGAGLLWPVPDVAALPTVPDEEAGTRIDVSGVLPAKIAALRAHRTQVSVWDGPPVGYTLSNSLAQPVPDAEYYMLVAGTGDGLGDDLFAGIDG